MMEKGTISVEIADAEYWKRQIKCQYACPVNTDARGYVRAIARGDFEAAYLIARGPNPLASICGRVCGAPCEASCRRGDIDQAISIRALKRFVTERFGAESGRLDAAAVLKRILSDSGQRECGGDEELGSMRGLLGDLETEGKRTARGPSPTPGRGGAPDAFGGGGAGAVAIIGSGPAGLAAAHDLALLGLRPVVFEMDPVPAGMLAVGIPAYRLPRELIEAEVEVIRALGVEFKCNVQVGKDISLEEIRQEFRATIIAVGAKYSRRLPVPGAEGPGVFGGVELLRSVALNEPVSLGQRVVVIGGGNVAYDVARSVIRQTEMDVSRTALRQSEVREVNMVSLESLEEMPADDVEIIEGDEEGVRRHHRLGPKEILRDERGNVRGMVFQRALQVFDERGRFAPQFDESDTVTIEADTVLWAIGQQADVSFIPAGSDVRLTERGMIECDAEKATTSAADVFVAGDIATGPSLLIHAVAGGKRAARAVHHFITGKTIKSQQTMVHRPISDYEREPDYEKQRRVSVPALRPEQRAASQTAVVELGYTVASARREAGRCLDCGVNTIFDSEKCILCGGCADICPELCLRLVSVSSLKYGERLGTLLEARYQSDELADSSAIIKDESRCIRCGLCAQRCPVGAITMERMTFQSTWVEVRA